MEEVEDLMPAVVIEVEQLGPQPSEGDTDQEEEDNPSPLFLERLKDAYTQFFDEHYEPYIPKNGKNEFLYHKINIQLDEEVREVTFDFDLFEQMFDVYMTEGWSGIDLIEKKLAENASDYRGPTLHTLKREQIQLSQWNYSYLLFSFSRNMLGLVIRESLISIERKAGKLIYDQLHTTYTTLGDIWRKYDIQKRGSKAGSYSLAGDGTQVVSYYYVIGQPTLSKDLFDLLRLAAKEFSQLKKLLEEYTYLKGKIAKAKPTAYPKGVGYYSNVVNNERLQELVTIIPLAEAHVQSLKNLISKQHPIGLLLLYLLPETFDQAEMENLLGATLDELRLDIETLVRDLRPYNYIVELLFKFEESSRLVSDILAFKVPREGLEEKLVTTALQKFKDKAYLSLLNDSVLVQLFDSQAITTDSLEYIAGQHYLIRLCIKLDEIEAKEKHEQDFWRNLQISTSALSLAVLVTPQTATLYPVFRGANALIGIALLCHSVTSVLDSLDQSNKLLRQSLITYKDTSVEGLSKLGNSIRFRQDLLKNMTEQMALEILYDFLLSKLLMSRHLIVARAFYGDLETLLENEDGSNNRQ